MKKAKAKYKKNDVIVHEETKSMMIIDSAEYMQNKGWLYTLRMVEAEARGDKEYKRYYEEKVNDLCEKMKNSKAAKVLYGRK